MHIGKKIQKHRIIKQFDSQLPRVLEIFFGEAKAVPLECFEYAADMMQSPSKEVFNFICDEINQHQLTADQAVRNAAKKYDLPVLDDFANIVNYVDYLNRVGKNDEAWMLLAGLKRLTKHRRTKQIEVENMLKQFKIIMAMSVLLLVYALYILFSNPIGAKIAPFIFIPSAVGFVSGYLVYRYVAQAYRDIAQAYRDIGDSLLTYTLNFSLRGKE